MVRARVWRQGEGEKELNYPVSQMVQLILQMRFKKHCLVREPLLQHRCVFFCSEEDSSHLGV